MTIYLYPGLSTEALENTNKCKNTSVVVYYDNVEDYKLICSATKKVIELAKKMDLGDKLDVSVSITDKLTINHTGTAVALFEPGSSEIQILSREVCKKSFNNKVILGQNIDDDLYKSMIIHELAHALAWQNKETPSIKRGLFEYFAYVVQFVLLDKVRREAIISSSDVEAFTHSSEITDVYYYLSPNQFAVKSYLHFIKLNDRWAYLSSILGK
jgi:hypothetical protein